MARSGFRAGDRDRAKALFRALPKSVRKGTERALLEAGTELAAAIKRRVPVDEGDLRDSVRVKRGKPARSSKGQIVDAAGADADLTIRVIEGDKETGYVYPVEFGAVDRPAQPHFFPTWREKRKRLKAKITRVQRKAIREAGKHG